MRSLGTLVLLAGISVAAFVYLPAPVDRGNSLDALRYTPSPPSAGPDAPVLGSGAFSPSIALPISPTPAPALVASDARSGWQTAVSVTAPAPVPATLPKTLSPTDPDARYKLVVDIQQQLKRVGCYGGRLDGSWGFATKDAMRDFTNRVNAALPLDEPDYVQLTLIQSHAERACGACPAGQSLSASGLCVGPPITAQAKQPNAQVASKQKEVLPWNATPAPSVASGQPLFKPMPTTVVSTEPLPGRMAIGAPVTTSVDAQQSVPSVPAAAATTSGATTAVVDSSLTVRTAPATTAPKAERRARAVGPGTPRYNLLLSLGGLY